MSSAKGFPFQVVFRKLRKKEKYFKNYTDFFMTEWFLSKNYYAIIECLNWDRDKCSNYNHFASL